MSVSVTLRDLLHASELRLVPLVSAHSAIDGDQAPVDWVHHSDLADPTPFVARNQVLLITRPRKIRTAQEYDVYVERLARVGVVALGFGVKVFSDETPPALIAACHRHQLRLFEVPFATPFIAVSRFVARKQAQLAQARDAQTLSALNGLSSAALRPDGVRSLLRELAKRLNGDVLLTDVLGTVTASAGTAVVPEIAERVRGEAHRLGSRGQRATSSFGTDEVYASLQTVGPGEGLRGILVVLTQRPVSPSDHAVATSAVALLALLLKQRARGIVITLCCAPQSWSCCCRVKPASAIKFCRRSARSCPKHPSWWPCLVAPARGMPTLGTQALSPSTTVTRWRSCPQPHPCCRSLQH
ncbi:PucR family transcriptional regulator ligand-binding domain-containing protein [Ornithinimicrobium sp. INDO-MA30-4]|uniref:PucR family transcriptional regulator ligand-binding domain-containing protein n=1 Tax=Ornithinimicrobium sp. INDO-MA30-4 TaxID=2908651 RepID=UPI001F16CE9B|nr:PucR family transcriptional regulator ligand-binding domain-containing protein [Ornithinimicrobium sp. INDO-MA30-4]UJH71396.1 PucR family transcriptional regulator ligand-binding domain-containing protein [Ornithinimicrobium sp. INDO-MA30-4]